MDHNTTMWHVRIITVPWNCNSVFSVYHCATRHNQQYKNRMVDNNAFMANLSLATTKMFLGLHVKCLTFLSNLNKIWIFYTNFHNKSPVLHFMAICPVGTMLIHVDRQTDRHRAANSCFSQLMIKR